MTLICVPITVHSILEDAAALTDAHEAKKRGADLVEWRVDSIFEGFDDQTRGEQVIACLKHLVDQSPLPCIVTCRTGGTSGEGGDYEGTENDRIELLRRLLMDSGKSGGVGNPPRYIDIEWSSFSRSKTVSQPIKEVIHQASQSRDLKTSLILSTHDFTGRPSDLLRRVVAMNDETTASVVKVAYRARSLHDSLELLSLPAQLAKPTIALGMGEFGVMSRILAPKFGAFLTFAALRQETASAPGQPTLDELIKHYRVRDIKQSTNVYGVIGYPVTHSLSPLVHNAAFRGANVNSVYVPLPIASYDDPKLSYASFRAALMELIEHPTLRFSGASFTMPHKEHLAQLASELKWKSDIAAVPMGAANTLTVKRNASGEFIECEVRNTDVAAFARLFMQDAQHTTSSVAQSATGEFDTFAAASINASALSNTHKSTAMRGRHIGVIGAGGAAKAAAFAALLMGAKVTIFNRDALRAASVAASLRAFASTDNDTDAITAASLEDIERAPCDTFVQATPVGMKGHDDRSLLPIPLMTQRGQNTTLIETVYAPIDTKAVRLARQAGWHVIDGAAMFVEQAALQSELWLGDKAQSIAIRESFESMVRVKLAN